MLLLGSIIRVRQGPTGRPAPRLAFAEMAASTFVIAVATKWCTLIFVPLFLREALGTIAEVTETPVIRPQPTQGRKKLGLPSTRHAWIFIRAMVPREYAQGNMNQTNLSTLISAYSQS